MKKAFYFLILIQGIREYNPNKERYARMKLTKYYEPTTLKILS